MAHALIRTHRQVSHKCWRNKTKLFEVLIFLIWKYNCNNFFFIFSLIQLLLLFKIVVWIVKFTMQLPVTTDILHIKSNREQPLFGWSSKYDVLLNVFSVFFFNLSIIKLCLRLLNTYIYVNLLYEKN